MAQTTGKGKNSQKTNLGKLTFGGSNKSLQSPFPVFSKINFRYTVLKCETEERKNDKVTENIGIYVNRFAMENNPQN